MESFTLKKDLWQQIPKSKKNHHRFIIMIISSSTYRLTNSIRMKKLANKYLNSEKRVLKYRKECRFRVSKSVCKMVWRALGRRVCIKVRVLLPAISLRDMQVWPLIIEDLLSFPDRAMLISRWGSQRHHHKKHVLRSEILAALRPQI